MFHSNDSIPANFTIKNVILGPDNQSETRKSLEQLFAKTSTAALNTLTTSLGTTFSQSDFTISYKNTPLLVTQRLLSLRNFDRYHDQHKSNYQHADTIIFVYAPSNETSFDEIKTFIDNQIEDIKNTVDGECKIMLVAHHSKASSSTVDHTTAMHYAKENDFIFFETSAEDESVNDLFTSIASLCAIKYDEGEVIDDSDLDSDSESDRHTTRPSNNSSKKTTPYPLSKFKTFINNSGTTNNPPSITNKDRHQSKSDTGTEMNIMNNSQTHNQSDTIHN